MFLDSLILAFALFLPTQSAFAATKTESVLGTLTLQLDSTTDPDNPDQPVNPDLPTNPDDPNNNGNGNNSGNTNQNNQNSALKASNLNNKSGLTNTGDVVSSILAFLVLIGSALAIFLIKSQNKIFASNNGVNEYNQSAHKSDRRNSLSKFKNITIAFLSILIALSGVFLVNSGLRASADSTTKSVDLTSKVIVNDNGEIKSSTLNIKNNLNTKVTINSVSLPSNLSILSCDLTSDNEVEANQTLSKDLSASSSAIGSLVLDNLKNNSGIVKYEFSAEVQYSAYSVKWYLNDGASTIYFEEQVAENGIAKMPGSSTSLEMEKYDFSSWNTLQDGTGATITSDYLGQNPVTADNNYYAKWTPKSYSITYDLNGGQLPQGSTNPEKYTYGTGVTSFVNPVKVGYTFDGWYNASDTKITKISTTDSGEVSLTAKYTANTNTAYTVKHYKQNLDDDEYSLSATNNMTGTTGSQTTITATSYTGFSAQSFEQKEIAGDGSTVIEIYYDRIKYQVTFNLNGHGTATPEIQMVKYEGKATKPAMEDITGFAFDGWYATSASTGNEFDFDNAKITAAITLYAKWTPVYTVTFDLNAPSGQTYKWGSTTSPATLTSLAKAPDYKIVNPDGVSGEPLCQTDTVYSFMGWYDSATGGNAITIGTSNVSANKTIYAHWEKVAFLAKVDGTNFDPTNTATYESGELTSITGVASVAVTIANGGANPNPTKYNATNDAYHLFARISGDGTSVNDWLECRIIHVGQHDSDGSGLTFQAVHALPERYKWDTKWTSGQAPNWSNCTLRTTLNSTILNTLPSTLQKNIKTLNKLSNATAGTNPNGGSTVNTQDKLWLISYTEITKNVINNSYWTDVNHDGSVYSSWEGKNLALGDPSSGSEQARLLAKLCSDRSGKILIPSGEPNGYSWFRTVECTPDRPNGVITLNSNGRVGSYHIDTPSCVYSLNPCFAM